MLNLINNILTLYKQWFFFYKIINFFFKKNFYIIWDRKAIVKIFHVKKMFYIHRGIFPKLTFLKKNLINQKYGALAVTRKLYNSSFFLKKNKRN